MPPVSSPGNVQRTSWVKKRSKPCQPTQSLAQRPVASDVQATDRPRPYCHWARSGSSRPVTRTVCGGGLGGRAVVAEQLRQAGLEAARMGDDAGLDREERLLDDLLAGDLLRLLEEDVGDRGRVGGRVVAAAALLGELPEEVRRRRRPAPDRGERDAGGLHALDEVGVLAAARPAVGEAARCGAASRWSARARPPPPTGRRRCWSGRRP